ncbi:LAMI_0E07074g1_1 [Lachancea mirantina]|uniref:LAMI_0E07074g1_1 n=1 Tax=Lachancea mirantina TaxID=1230905 RepID=A0A1G4JM96_9SACH|nr:LAMI_0E07074g1_1 [Lachancea mirantina]
MFHTPPINNPKFDLSQSIKESYQVRVETNSPVLSNSSSNGSGSVNRDEIVQEIANITALPTELSKLIDIFIDDLKQPKYLKPLNVLQLCGLFQSFYGKFDKAAFQCLSRTGENAQGSFLTARESLSSGISGIFNRSRSSSDTRKRSSSLFSTDSANGVQPLLTPEELAKHVRTNEINNHKIERYMDLCEHDVFKRILEVGTSVPNNTAPKSEKSGQARTLKVSNLFRNSPEFIDYDRQLSEKLEVLAKLAKDGKLNLIEFLSIRKDDLKRRGVLTEYIEKLVYGSIAPFEKLQNIIAMHDEMTSSFNHLSNDDFLSTLIYLIVINPVKNIFLNLQFIKLFRYSKKLVEKDLYALTNLEAALKFVENLTFTDLPKELQDQLSSAEADMFRLPLSSKVALPDIDLSSENSGTRHPGLPRSNSYMEFEGFRTALDFSLRNIIGKLRSYTPPVASNPVAPNSNTTNANADIVVPQSISSETTTMKKSEIPESWKEYRNREFDDLKVSELKQVFSNYQKLLDALDS